MIQLLRIIVFSLLMIGFFSSFSNFGIPQIVPAPPPVDEVIDLTTMTIETFVELGERIFKGKGTCTLCHNDVGGRAPMLDQVGNAIRARLADTRYKGSAASLQEYIYESMTMPSAFVVAGFGKMGTNDTESPMPDVKAGGIGLSEVEILAVIAYLQDLNGIDITVVIPEGAATTSDNLQVAEQAVDAGSGSRAKYQSPEEMITKLACGACHTVDQFKGQIGPDLSHIGNTRSKEYLRRSILNPNADIAEGFTPLMPPIYGDQLYASEMEMLVEYLSSLK